MYEAPRELQVVSLAIMPLCAITMPPHCPIIRLNATFQHLVNTKAEELKLNYENFDTKAESNQTEMDLQHLEVTNPGHFCTFSICI